MPTKIQIKRGLSQNFAATTLSAGEPAFVSDLGKLYVGDGTNKILINPIDKPVGLNTSNYFTKFKVNLYGQVVEADTISEADLPSISSTKITGLGTAAITNTGTSAGNVPVLNGSGKLETSILPPLAISNTFVVGNEAAMLALDTQTGDIAVRTDINESFILQKEPATDIKNWIKLLTPTDTVLSVNDKTGTVTLAGTDIKLTAYAKAASYSAVIPTDSTSSAIGKLEANFANLAPIASPTFTGTPSAVTQVVGTNTTTLATCAFVQTAIATIDGGTF